MGIKLAEYFEAAKQVDGLTSQVKLAMLTKMSAKQALDADDTVENLQLFETAMNQVRAAA